MFMMPPVSVLRRPVRTLSHVASSRRTFSPSSGRMLSHVASSGAVPLLLVLVGIPGSGKSTFVQELLTTRPPDSEWSRVSQDVLGTRKRCVRAAQDALLEGRHVAIDRCNFDREQRAHWLRLHPPQGTRVAVFIDVPASVAYDRVLARPAHEGGVDSLHMTPFNVRGIVRSMSASLTPPREEEGFTHILHCTEDSEDSARGGGVTFSRRGAVARVLELAQLDSG